MADNEFERIQPATLDLDPAATGDRSTAIPAARGARTLDPMMIALAVVLLLGALVVFVLPRFLNQAPPTAGDAAATMPSPDRAQAAAPVPPATASGPSPTAAAPAAAKKDESSPWQEAQRAHERDVAKQALDALLALQYELQEMRAEVWAAQEFASATEAAKRGDEAWRAERYAEAQKAWQEGEQTLRAVQEGIPARLAARLDAGDAAFAAGDAAAAVAAYSDALAIEPGNVRAQQGLARAGNLEQMKQLMAEGTNLESAGERQAAREKYAAALALDPAWEPAQRALAALDAKITTDKAATEVSAGYAALAAGRIDEARRAFQAALKLGAGAPARDGLQQAEFQSSQQRISSLLAKAEAAERGEQWQAALDASSAALAIDQALAPARESRDRASRRLALDKAMQKLASEPSTMSTDAGRATADKLIVAASEIPDPGPRLRAQIDGARRNLAEMRTKVAVTLRSDGQTQVTVFRVGDLGRFDEHRLDLLPGDYVAVGRRDGYRDVRIQFAVRPGSGPAPVNVQCQQRI